MLSVNERHNKEKVSNSIVLFTLRIYTAQITYKIHCREISRQENFVYFKKWTIAGHLTIERLFIVINAELNFVVFIFFFSPTGHGNGEMQHPRCTVVPLIAKPATVTRLIGGRWVFASLNWSPDTDRLTFIRSPRPRNACALSRSTPSYPITSRGL